MRNEMIGYRVVERSGRVLTNWGRLRLADLIPGDDCWGRLVFLLDRPAVATEEGVPYGVQVVVNTDIPSALYDILLFEDERRNLEVGGQVEVDRVTIDIEGGIVWESVEEWGEFEESQGAEE